MVKILVHNRLPFDEVEAAASIPLFTCILQYRLIDKRALVGHKSKIIDPNAEIIKIPDNLFGGINAMSIVLDTGHTAHRHHKIEMPALRQYATHFAYRFNIPFRIKRIAISLKTDMLDNMHAGKGSQTRVLKGKM